MKAGPRTCFQSKLLRRGVSLKSLDAGGAALVREAVEDHRGHQGGHHAGEREKVTKLIRDEGPRRRRADSGR